MYLDSARLEFYVESLTTQAALSRHLITRNYVVRRKMVLSCYIWDFGNEEAWCASDLGTNELKLLLSKPVSHFHIQFG